MSKKKTNYDKAVAIYEAKGQSAVFTAADDGTLKVDCWAYCEPCETESPIEGGVCLVCGTLNDGLTREQEAFKTSYLHNVAVASAKQVTEFLVDGDEVFLKRHPKCGIYTSLMDAYGIWGDALRHAKNNA
jgi:hypothetical protein